MTKSEYDENNIFEIKENDNEIGLDTTNLLKVPEHRSGWNYVTSYLKKLHNPNGFVLVDFVEKIWCWDHVETDKDKGIFFENNAYYVDPKYIKMINNIQCVVLEVDSEKIGVFWNGKKWDRANIDVKYIEDADQYGIFTKNWVGIIHNPTNIPHWFDYENSPQELIKNENFKKSLPYCKGLFVFSEYLRQELLNLGGWPCEINVLKHPTGNCDKKWNPNIIEETSINLVQVGFWLRKLTSIYELNVSEKYKKAWINRAEYGFRCFEREVVDKQNITSLLNRTDKVNILNLEDDEYDNFLQNSIVFLDLYDSSCNNAIIESIVRHVPIVVNRLPAVEEYLGKDYALYFEDLSEVNNIVNNKQLIMKAHSQLVELEKSNKFYGDYLLEQIQNSTILKKKKNHYSHLISLGVDCFPRSIATKFGFKKRKLHGELTCPFDLAWHDYSTVCELLNNNFDGYLESTNLYINDTGCITHRKYNILFNHESDTIERLFNNIKNDYDNFKSIYTARIQNFYNLIHNTPDTETILFILHYNKYPTELIDILKFKFPSLKFVILTFNIPYYEDSYLNQPTNVEIPYNNFVFYTIRKPTTNYIWYETQDVVWEKQFETILTNLIFKVD